MFILKEFLKGGHNEQEPVLCDLSFLDQKFLAICLLSIDSNQRLSGLECCPTPPDSKVEALAIRLSHFDDPAHGQQFSPTKCFVFICLMQSFLNSFLISTCNLHRH